MSEICCLPQTHYSYEPDCLLWIEFGECKVGSKESCPKEVSGNLCKMEISDHLFEFLILSEMSRSKEIKIGGEVHHVKGVIFWFDSRSNFSLIYVDGMLC